MQKCVEDVRQFHIVSDLPHYNRPRIPTSDRIELRIKLINEEVNKELIPAMEANQLVEIADGIADAIYVLVGAAIEYGIPLTRVWNAVQKANMAKVDPTTGKVRKRADGKVLKPEGWKAPDIVAALGIEWSVP